MTCQPDASRASVCEKECVVGSQLAERCGQEFRPDRFDAGPLLDIVLQEFMERGGLREMLLQETVIALVAEFGEQCGDGRLDIADEP